MSKTKLLLAVIVAAAAGTYLLLAGLIYFLQDAIIYPAPRGEPPAELVVWTEAGKPLGYMRPAVNFDGPRRVWLVFQGNGSAAGMREYFAEVPGEDALHIMEYPGYGTRSGTPNASTINAASVEAYDALRRRYPGVPLGVVGESFGSGPACALTRRSPAPDSVTLIVPLADFREAIGRLFRLPLARWLVRDQWDNRAALRAYAGPVTIYAAEADEVLLREATESLAASRSGIELVWIAGGHVAPGNSREIPLGRR